MKKQVAIIGMGQFGNHLARSLARMNCEVLAIDMDEKAINTLRDHVHRTVIADARDLEALQSVVTKDIDEAIVCLSKSLEASILSTLHLQQIGIKRIRAKASSEDHASILKAVGATDVIFPEQETAQRMAHRIAHPNLLDFLPLADEYRVVEIDPPDQFVGRSLVQLQLRNRYKVFVIAIKSADRKLAFLPPGDTVLTQNNTLVVIGKDKDIQRLGDIK